LNAEERRPELDELEPLVGTWGMEANFDTGEPVAGGSVTFEWMPGGKFLMQRWTIPVPEAPDGLAVIGWDEGRGTLLQHYFDSRGVTRLYEAAMKDREWTLSRTEADFSPLNFSQRYSGKLSADGSRIDGEWQINHGEKWERDFGLSYVRNR
jgi:hypothetical protein